MDPRGALPRDDTDANLGELPSTSARNRAHVLLLSSSASAGAEADEFAPDEKVPRGQARQVELASAPTAAENVPAGHSVQLLACGPHDPALQLQFVTVVLPVGDMALVGHACLSLAELAQ